MFHKVFSCLFDYGPNNLSRIFLILKVVITIIEMGALYLRRNEPFASEGFSCRTH